MEDILKLIEKTRSGNGDSDKHLMCLFGIALGLNAKTIVELGVRNGDTTLPLSIAAQCNDGHLYSVDINDCTSELPYYLKEHQTFIKSDAIEFLENWNDKKTIDLVYIDDWHSYDHVKKELEVLDRLVSPSTVILIHDLMYGGTEPFYHSDITLKDGQWGNGGPYRAVAELNQQFWEFSTLPYNNGLTILRKKYSSLYKKK